jgi:hypothetical protein
MNRTVLLCAALLTLLACGNGGGEEKKQTTETDPVNNYFDGEVRPMVTINCFQGAYYRKAVSSKDRWLGIGGEVTLPQITFDEGRKNPAKPGQYLDNPSIYMGGNMGGQETDIGLTWEVIRDENGVVSAERLAFRPFLRRTGHASGQVSNYMNAPAEAKYYWFPGEKVTMSLEIVSDGRLLFVVDGAGKRYETQYDSAGYKAGNIGEFKRVNAIDQVSNEGKPAQTTATRVENSTWHATWLLRSYQNEVVKAPMHSGRFTDMRCPGVKYFKLTATDTEKKNGGETININGAGY